MIEFYGFGCFRVSNNLYGLATCSTCLNSVLMTDEERQSKKVGGQDLILHFLDETSGCCSSPSYHFRTISPFPKAKKEG